jgi:TPP-dependent pyruvate/acetoin dehydrogenase alpha subunit
LKITPQQHCENHAQNSRQYRQERLIGEWQKHIGIGNFEKHLTGTEWANYKAHRTQQRKISRLKAQEARLIRKAQLIDDAKS